MAGACTALLAQGIVIPNTFVNGTVADATQVNANFTAVSSNALNRTGGTMTGTLNAQHLLPVTDATYDVGSTLLKFRDGWFSRDLTVVGTAIIGGAASVNGASFSVSSGTVINVNSGQIAFPATQNPSANANTLDDYAEGNWTPTITGSGGSSSQTYTAQSGRYLKIGRKVHVQGTLTLNAVGTVTTSAEIGGLPFSSTNVPNKGTCSVGSWTGLATNWGFLSGYVEANSTVIVLTGIKAGATVTAAQNMVQGDLATGTQFFVSCEYEAAN
jgi:hypothetical protein